jgi:VanZ family protein
MILAIIISILFTVAALIPSNHIPSLPGSDKVHHALAFGLISFPVAFARSQSIFWIILVASAYGGLIEVIQAYVGRDGDIKDAAANTLGAVCGTVSGKILRHSLDHYYFFRRR